MYKYILKYIATYGNETKRQYWGNKTWFPYKDLAKIYNSRKSAIQAKKRLETILELRYKKYTPKDYIIVLEIAE